MFDLEVQNNNPKHKTNLAQSQTSPLDKKVAIPEKQKSASIKPDKQLRASSKSGKVRGIRESN
jgi:hypothetical protein